VSHVGKKDLRSKHLRGSEGRDNQKGARGATRLLPVKMQEGLLDSERWGESMTTSRNHPGTVRSRRLYCKTIAPESVDSSCSQKDRGLLARRHVANKFLE